MNLSELKFHVNWAIDCLYAHDGMLLRANASEWAIAHRLAVYLEQRLPQWNIDCEYNRQGIGRHPKRNEPNRRIRPDIIIHHRGQIAIQHNLLVIEMKKRGDRLDLDKVCKYTALPNGTRRFQYQYGLSVSLIPTVEAHWFQNGAELNGSRGGQRGSRALAELFPRAFRFR